VTLEQLRIFVAVAERLHMTQAAAALRITQSAASAAIQALEARLGVSLFNRVGRHIELTEAGDTLLPHAKAVLGRVSDAEVAISELVDLEHGRLRLCASQTIAGYWLPARMHRFQIAHPKIALELRIANTLQVARLIAAGEADLGFVEGSVDDPLLARIPVASDQLVLVVAASHPWAKRERIEAVEMTKTRWVLRETGSGTRQMFEDALRAAGIAPEQLDLAMELPSNEAVRAAVEAGAGATVVSRLVASSGLQSGVLKELSFAFPDRPFIALRHGDRHRSAAERAFLDLIRVK
jgi:DNA-binding transcriptional LysR family regulator